MEWSHREVRQAARSLADAASAAGLDVDEIRGTWTVCSVHPPQDKYAAGASAAPSTATAAEVVASVTSALEEDGWTVVTSTTQPEPDATFRRGELRAVVGVARRIPSDVFFRVTGPCVATSEDFDGGKDVVDREAPR